MQGREKVLCDVGFDVVGKKLQMLNRVCVLKDRVWDRIVVTRKDEGPKEYRDRLLRTKAEIQSEIDRIYSYAVDVAEKGSVERIVCRTLWSERRRAVESIDNILDSYSQMELPF